MPSHTPLERLVIVLLAVLIALGAIAALSGFFAGQDQAGVGDGGAGPGQAFADQGDRPLTASELRPVYDSDPPTSGAHRPEAIARDRTELTVDQLLEALALGDVVVDYGTRRPPPALVALAGRIAPFSPALAIAGQAVVLARRPHTSGLIGLAWAHMLRVRSAADPALAQFLSFWLGRRAPGRSP